MVVIDRSEEGEKRIMRFARAQKGNRYTFWGLWHAMEEGGDSSLCGDFSLAAIPEGTLWQDMEDAPENICRACCHHLNGYKVEKIRGGQVRRYGPTINEWRITDLSGDLTEEEVKAYCLKNVSRAALRTDPNYHSLSEHVQAFVHLGDGVYRYQTGHDWTG